MVQAGRRPRWSLTTPTPSLSRALMPAPRCGHTVQTSALVSRGTCYQVTSTQAAVLDQSLQSPNTLGFCVWASGCRLDVLSTRQRKSVTKMICTWAGKSHASTPFWSLRPFAAFGLRLRALSLLPLPLIFCADRPDRPALAPPRRQHRCGPPPPSSSRRAAWTRAATAGPRGLERRAPG